MFVFKIKSFDDWHFGASYTEFILDCFVESVLYDDTCFDFIVDCGEGHEENKAIALDVKMTLEERTGDAYKLSFDNDTKCFVIEKR